MYRTISICLLTLISAVLAFAQTPDQVSQCKLTANQVSIRGVKLGMTVDELRGLL